jgi:hypothetical protein
LIDVSVKFGAEKQAQELIQVFHHHEFRMISLPKKTEVWRRLLKSERGTRRRVFPLTFNSNRSVMVVQFSGPQGR